MFIWWQKSTYTAFRLNLGAAQHSARPPTYGGISVVESSPMSEA